MFLNFKARLVQGILLLGNYSLSQEAAEGVQVSTVNLVNASGSMGWTIHLLVSQQPMASFYTGRLLSQSLASCPAEGARTSWVPHSRQSTRSALQDPSTSFCPQGTLLPSQYEDILQTLKICLEEGTPQHKLRPSAEPAGGPMQGQLRAIRDTIANLEGTKAASSPSSVSGLM